MKKILLYILLTLGSKFTFGQDPFFTQFSVSPMTINPSLIGSGMSHLNRTSFITRSQWWGGGSQPYITNNFNYERRIISGLLNENNKLTGGLTMLNERSNGGILSSNYFSAAISDQVRVSENGILKLALSGTYYNRMLDLSMATFQTQFGSFGFNNTNSYDPISTTNTSNFELNAGMAYERTTTNLDYEIGGALFHISKPKEGMFNNGNYLMDPRGVGHASLKWRPNSKGEFLFSSNIQIQAKKHLTIIGGAYTVNLHDDADHKLTFGLWDRVNESISSYFSLQVKTLKFGLSYDVPTNSVHSSFNSVKSFEGSIVWEFGK